MAAEPELATNRPWTRFYDEGVPARLTYPDIGLHQILEESARRYPQDTALIFFGHRITYAELDALATRFAAGLQRLGVRRGTPVSLHLPNSPQFVIAYFGILKAAGVAVPHNPLYTEREIGAQLKDAGVEVAVTLNLVYPRVAAAAPAGVRHIIPTAINEFMPPHLRLLYPLKARREGQWVRVAAAPPRVVPFGALLADAPLQPVQISPDNPALYQYTGGTTGTPKAAVLTHRNMVGNTIQAAAWFPGSGHAGERSMGVLPLFHIYCLTAVLNFSLRMGMAVVLIPRFDPEMVLHAVRRYRPTVFHGVPTMYTTLLNHPRLSQTDMRPIRSCISGAMGLPQEVQRRWEEATGGRLVEGYGLTEAAPITHCTPVAGHRRPGSIGVPFPDTDSRIVESETGRTLPPGEVGELAVRGPQVMHGYLNRPGETAAVLRDGWLFTGDIARMDEDGFFYIVDRKKEMINVAGLKVFPREVEEVLYQHPAVREAAAIPAPDSVRGEVVKAFVALKAGASASPEELIAFCRQRMAPHKVPRAVEFREALPKTLIGKILRRALVEEDRRGVT